MLLVARALAPVNLAHNDQPPAAASRDKAADPLRRSPPGPGSFLEPAAGGAFSLVPLRHPGGVAALVQVGLPDPLLAGLLPPRPRLRLVQDLPPVPPLSPPAVPKAAARRRSA